MSKPGFNFAGQCQGCAKLPQELRGLRTIVGCDEKSLVICCEEWQCEKCCGRGKYCSEWEDDPQLAIGRQVVRFGASLRRYGRLVDLGAPTPILENEIRMFMKRKLDLLARREETLRYVKAWISREPEKFDSATDGELLIDLDELIIKISKTLEPNMGQSDEDEDVPEMSEEEEKEVLDYLGQETKEGP